MATIDELDAQVAQLRAEVEQLRGQIASADFGSGSDSGSGSCSDCS